MSLNIFKERFLVLLHLSTTCDEHQVCVTKDTAETIKLAWLLIDTSDMAERSRASVLVRPSNTPVTDLCSKSTIDQRYFTDPHSEHIGAYLG